MSPTPKTPTNISNINLVVPLESVDETSHCIKWSEDKKCFYNSSGSIVVEGFFEIIHFHFIEQPIEAIWFSGPLPVFTIMLIASNSSSTRMPSLPIVRLSNRPRYWSSKLELNPKKSGVQTAPKALATDWVSSIKYGNPKLCCAANSPIFLGLSAGWVM